MTINRNGFLKDPRFRSSFNNFLQGAQARRNVRGIDLNRGQQALSAVQGRHTHRNTLRPRTGTGQRLQNFLRNRSNEQGGTGTPSRPSIPVRPATPRRF